MPRVLVLGATGFLGSAVAASLVRSGLHSVYGLVRSQSKAASLSALELIPVVCEDPANKPEPYLNAITNHRIDVVVDCTAAYGDSAKFHIAVRDLGKKRLELFKSEGIASGPKIGYIYCSGAWVHGDSTGHVTDLDAVGTASSPSKPLDLVSWRPELERLVLSSRDVLDVLIVRPAQMYGRASSAWTPLFAPLGKAVSGGEATCKIPMPNTSQSPVIHVDDVADAITKGVGRISLFGNSSVYPIFDLVSTTENIKDIMEALAKSLHALEGKGGKTDLQFVGPGDDIYMKALGSTVVYDSSRAKELLGWEPKRIGLVRNMDVYAAAWKALLK